MIPLLIFFSVFLLILIRTFMKSARAEQERAVRLPLDDGGES